MATQSAVTEPIQMVTGGENTIINKKQGGKHSSLLQLL